MPNTLASRKLVGLLVPAFNSTVEPELARLCPQGVTHHTARFEMNATLLDNLAAEADKLVSCHVDGLLVGLSTDTIPGGLALAEKVASDLTERTGLPVVTASQAVHHALAHLGVERIALVTPFDVAANETVKGAFEAAGFEVVAAHGLALPSLDSIGQAPLSDIRAAFAAADDEQAEALVHVGTGLPVVNLIEELERTHHKPVVACNAAAYWQLLRRLGIDDAIPGHGRLLAEA